MKTVYIKGMLMKANENKCLYMLYVYIKKLLWNRPIGLQNVNDPNVDQQPLSFSITSWNTTHAKKSKAREKTTDYFIVLITGLETNTSLKSALLAV